MKRITIVCASVIFAAIAGAASLSAQSLSGLHIGEPSANLSRLGSATASDTYKAMAVRRWVLPNGNDLSATTAADNTIVYLESDWNGKSDDPGCDLVGLRFGVTTLADIRKRFGSNGFGYRARGDALETQDGVVMINSYEVGKSVITFYTKINAQEYSRIKATIANSSPADYARLDAISIADDNYAKSEWGDPVYDPAYKKIEWK